MLMDLLLPVDLTIATAKTLVRLRRDDLIRLCESRDLEPTGTKPQLAEALLQWRDNQANDFSCPSSTGTAHPPSTIKKRGHRRRHSPNRSRKSSQKTATPPLLLRSDRVHIGEPKTPPLLNAGIQNDKPVGEPELELDLGTLGLEDREIPPEKLQKLEKIGSGGFKDVFIGKFKGRRIAISEFRGQLSASTWLSCSPLAWLQVLIFFYSGHQRVEITGWIRSPQYSPIRECIFCSLWNEQADKMCLWRVWPSSESVFLKVLVILQS